MEYYAKIQDINNLEDELILEFSRRGDIGLKWLGGDDKTQPIVGSEFNFSLKAEDCDQLKYEKYFTSNEQKWLVSVFLSADDDDLIWKGFLLPESYSEPYKQGVKFVVFSAVDGLGLLKGKTLTEDFYSDEKYLHNIIGSCLKLTGLNFQFWVSPAIKNANGALWKNLLVDTRLYYDEKKLSSAYDFLEEILSSMRCQIYQADGRFYIEGINKRFLVTVTYEVYGLYNGNNEPYLYGGRIEKRKNIKELTFLESPTIDLIAPLRSVTAEHEANLYELPKEVYKLSDTAFDAHYNTQINYYLSHYWDINNGYRPEVRVSDNLLLLPNYAQNDVFTENRKINLREKPYILKGSRMSFKMEIDLYFPNEVTSPNDDLIKRWIDYAVYRISINGNEVKFNLNSNEISVERLTFDDSGSAEVEFDFIAKENGYLDIEFFEPYKSLSETKASGYIVKSIELKNESDDENFTFTTEGVQDASQTHDLDLKVADDITGFSKSFYLEKTRDFSNSYTSIERSIYDTFGQNGKNYAQIDIMTAYLIEQFKGVNYAIQVFNDSTAYNIDGNVTYNFEGSEMHVVEIGSWISGLKIRIKYRRYKTVTDRENWVKWSDEIYKIEQKPFVQVAAEIEQKLFSIPYIKLDGACLNPIKFNDIVKFRYKDVNRYFYVSNCEWTPDNRSSSFILHEGIYNGARYGTLPPYVDAGEDKLISPTAQNSNANAIAFDPDGNIENIEWTQIEGDTTATINNGDTLNPSFSGMTGNHYVFQVEVTDNTGNTATDIIEVNRTSTHSISFYPSDEEYTNVGEVIKTGYTKYELAFINPPPVEPIPNNYSFNLVVEIELSYKTDLYANAYILINKNGQQFIYEIEKLSPVFPTPSFGLSKKFKEEFNFREGTEFTAEIYVKYQNYGTGSTNGSFSEAKLTVIESIMKNGYEEITNLPEAVVVRVDQN